MPPLAQAFEPQHLGNTLWALSKQGIRPDDVWMDAFMLQLKRSVARLAPVDVSNVLYGLASLGFEPRGAARASLMQGLMQQLVAERPVSANGIRGRVGETSGSPQALANGMWALATMSVLPNKTWMEEVSDWIGFRW